MNRIVILCLLIVCCQFGFSQSNCGCDGVDMTWLEEVKDNITEEILNPPVQPCGFSDGTITQCSYLGQTVFVYVPTILPCDVATQVHDCNGNFLFSYGGFCLPSCPGEDQVQFLENCEVIYSVPPVSMCDNSCAGTDAVLLNVACVNSNVDDSSVCVPISANNFLGIIQFDSGIAWDPTLLQYSGINGLALSNSDFSLNETNIASGELFFQWISSDAIGIPNETGLFEICFDILGPLESMSTIELIDLPNFEIEVLNEIGNPESICIESGSVSIGTGEQIAVALDSLQVNFCGETAIPTLGQWAIICLSMLFMIVGIIGIKENRMIMDL